MNETEGTALSKGRIEAFSDGVFAIVITLLVLELRVPRAEALHDGSLWQTLLGIWPSYLAYVISFLVVGVVWINHHAMFHYIARSSHTLLVLNLLLLMTVTTLPFTAALLAEYIRGTEEQRRIATLVYTGLFALGGVGFNAVWLHAVRAGLLDPRLPPEQVRLITLNYARGPLLYFLAFLLAFVSMTLSLVMYGLLLLSFFLPSPSEWRRRIVRAES